MKNIHSLFFQPPSQKRRKFSIKFVTQARVQSPTFVLFAANDDLCTPTYLRYIEARIREKYPFTGTPLRFIVNPVATKRNPKKITSRRFKKPLKKAAGASALSATPTAPAED